MSRRWAAFSSATIVLMATLATGATLQNQTGTSAGVGCAYLSGSDFRTLVLTVETDGPQAPPVTRGMSCAAATTVLTDRGFGFVEMGSFEEQDFDGNGMVDAADYVVWRNGFRNGIRNTTVITACAHFSGPEFSTELIGVEHDGPQQPPRITGMSCAAAFNALINRGFVLLYEGPTAVLDLNSDGVADSEDYAVWRANFGTTAGQ